MLSLDLIREDTQKVKKGVVTKGCDPKAVDKVLKLDLTKRGLIKEIEELRSERNIVSKQKDIKKGKEIKEKLQKLEPDLNKVEKELNLALQEIPNLPDENIPKGKEENKRVIKTEGKPKDFGFTPKDHLDLGTSLGIIDTQRAAKVSGSRFTYLKGDAVLLEMALINFAVEHMVKEGFTPVLPPMLIKKEITDGLGYWHGGGNANYYYVMDFEEGKGEKELQNPLYLIGTGEHSVVPMHKGEVFNEKDLPKKYVAFSSCFRREAGSYGKDTKGILRVHQFDKVEMVVFCKPEEDEKTMQKMLSYSERLMKELDLPYQVVELATEDIGFPTAKTYDIEVLLPGQGKYRETHSISTTTDYQARGLNIKYKSSKGNEYVHILNGTTLAVGRTIIGILENYQNKDGSVNIPKVLQKWMGKDKISVK
ncbi:serine--tRNA ligase [Patescibacteria group bacterium]